jgi:phage-related protein
VQFAGIVYVLHVFQKKSKTGVATPKMELELVERRYPAARQHYETL